MTDSLNTQNIITDITYGVANEVLQVSANTLIANSETRQYNSMFQLTRLTEQGTSSSVLDVQCAYLAGANNGKITSQIDTLVTGGEQVVYTYDALNRLATAVTADNLNVTQWGQSYTYDGFGNLTDQNVIKGSAPTMHVVYNASTNRQTGDVADANGNIGSGNVYDMDNRLVQPNGSTARYGYDAGNKRVWRGDTSVDEIAFWAGNQKLATYNVSSTSCVCFTLSTTNAYFGGKVVSQGKKWASGADQVLKSPVAQDRLGSMNGKFYPYGQERPSATANDKEKFTGYFRDASTGFDYADQRYEQPGVGRFMTPDSMTGSLNDPGSLNKYAYTRGDPVNRVDPSGTCDYDLCGTFIFIDPSINF